MENKNDLKGILIWVFLVISLLLGGFIIYDKLLKKDTKNEQERECEKCLQENEIPVGVYISSLDGGRYTIEIRKDNNSTYIYEDKCGDDMCTYADAKGYVAINGNKLVLINEKCGDEYNNCAPYYEFKYENGQIISVIDNNKFTKK